MLINSCVLLYPPDLMKDEQGDDEAQGWCLTIFHDIVGMYFDSFSNRLHEEVHTGMLLFDRFT